jgi:hypothetical protein
VTQSRAVVRAICAEVDVDRPFWLDDLQKAVLPEAGDDRGSTSSRRFFMSFGTRSATPSKNRTRVLIQSAQFQTGFGE